MAFLPGRWFAANSGGNVFQVADDFLPKDGFREATTAEVVISIAVDTAFINYLAATEATWLAYAQNGGT